MSDEMRQKLHDILRSYLPDVGDGPIPADRSLAELGLSSLASVNLVLDVEDTFDIEFPDAMLSEATFHSAGALESVLRRIVTGSDTVIA
jgi:acyl carrier protein